MVEAPEKRVAHKERRACDYENPTAGWTREKYDARVAQILVQYENVVYAALPNMDAAWSACADARKSPGEKRKTN